MGNTIFDYFIVNTLSNGLGDWDIMDTTSFICILFLGTLIFFASQLFTYYMGRCLQWCTRTRLDQNLRYRYKNDEPGHLVNPFNTKHWTYGKIRCIQIISGQLLFIFGIFLLYHAFDLLHFLIFKILLLTIVLLITMFMGTKWIFSYLLRPLVFTMDFVEKGDRIVKKHEKGDETFTIFRFRLASVDLKNDIHHITVPYLEILDSDKYLVKIYKIMNTMV